MLLNILFGLVVLIDVGAVLLFFVLGLAFAGPSHTSGFAVAGIALVPVVLLAGATIVFVKAKATVWRVVALLFAASPALFVAGAQIYTAAMFSANSDAGGNLLFYRSGPLREMATAIVNNDAAAVAALASKVNVNEKGMEGMTLLTMAMRQLRAKPGPPEVLRILLRAGADPNVAPGMDDLPLTTALQLSGKTGPEPVRLLLDAGAKVNTLDAFGTPVYFGAVGFETNMDALAAVLDKGADLQMTGKNGTTVLDRALQIPSWKAARLLIERGAKCTRCGAGEVEILRTKYRGNAEAEEVLGLLGR